MPTVNAKSPGQPAAMAGAVVLLTGAETPLGAAVARRLAAEAGPLLLCLDAARPAGQAVLAEVHRVRALHRNRLEAEAIPADPGTEEGARALLAQVLDAYGRLDVLVHIVESPCSGEVTDGAPLDRLLPLVRAGAGALDRQGGGRLVAVVDLSDCRGAVPRQAIETGFEDLVHAAARALAPAGVTVNGVLVDASRSAADRALALAAGPAPGMASPPAEPVHSASGVIAMLASPTSGGLSGQILRLGPTAALPPAPPNLVALFARPALA
jgi:3-oxoacyl-[acyl-carrier protein] reductase